MNEETNNNPQPTFELSKIKLIVGLGNLGNEFIGTRHNVGFEFVDALVSGKRFKETTPFFSDVLESEISGHKVILAKPRTMMNLSGRAVQAIKNFYKINSDEIVIVHDDLDIELGSFKLNFSKGPKVHNGILSIENKLGTQDFWRLRIGVDSRTTLMRNHMSGASYVLGRFKADERSKIIEVYGEIIEKIFK